MADPQSHIFKGVWMVKFRGRDILGRLVDVGQVAAGGKAYDAPWTLEAQDGPIMLRLTAPRRRFRRPPGGAFRSEAELLDEQNNAE